MKPEIRALIERGNITLDEIKALRCNSEEWRAIYPKLDDEALEWMAQHFAANTGSSHVSSYASELASLFVPEIVTRWAETRARLAVLLRSASAWRDWVSKVPTPDSAEVQLAVTVDKILRKS
jgi:hypothetical protein